MPVQYPDFPHLSFNEANPWLVGAERGMNMFEQGQRLQHLSQMNPLEEAIKKVQAQYAEPMTKEELIKAQQANQWNPKIWQSEIGLRGAQSGHLGAETNQINKMLPYEIQKIKQFNELYPEFTRSQIAMNNMGGRGMGTGGKEELMFQQLVSKDNPQLGNDPNKIYEASNVLRQGGSQLSDGTPLKPLSPASQASFDRLTKGTTYAGVATPLINAVGAEKEIDVLSKYAQEGLKPYGDTILGYNSDQVMDTFKDDVKSQTRLGRFIGAQQLQFEIAQNQNRIAMGQPGITNTQELMDRSMQSIKAKYPMLSYAARKEANRYFTEGLKKALEARKSAGVSVTKALGNSSAVSDNLSGTPKRKVWTRDENGQLVESQS